MTQFLLYGGRAAGKVIYIPESHVGQPWVVPIYPEPDSAVYPDDAPPSTQRRWDEIYYPKRLNMLGDRIIIYAALSVEPNEVLNQFQRDAILNIFGGYRG